MASFSITAVVFSVGRIQSSDMKFYHDDGVEYSAVPALLFCLSPANRRHVQPSFELMDYLNPLVRTSAQTKSFEDGISQGVFIAIHFSIAPRRIVRFPSVSRWA